MTNVQCSMTRVEGSSWHWCLVLCWSLGFGHWCLFYEVLLKHNQIIRMGRIPADADDVVAERYREVDELSLVVHALAADVFVAMVLGPGLLGFLELTANAVAAHLAGDGA